MVSYQAKALFNPHGSACWHAAEIRPKASAATVSIEVVRNDAKGCHRIALSLEDARVLLRDLQSACDRAHHNARTAAKDARQLEELHRELDRLEGAR